MAFGLSNDSQTLLKTMNKKTEANFKERVRIFSLRELLQAVVLMLLVLLLLSSSSSIIKRRRFGSISPV